MIWSREWQRAGVGWEALISTWRVADAQGTPQCDVACGQKQLIEVPEGCPGLQTDDTPMTVSVEVWFDVINSRELEPHKDEMKKKRNCLYLSVTYPPVRLIPAQRTWTQL